MVVLALALTVGGCPFFPAGRLPAVPYATLPSDKADLISFSDRIIRRTRRVPELVRARTALRKAQDRWPGDFHVLWRLARVDGLLTEADPKHAGEWAVEGYNAAVRARTQGPDRVQGHLYYAVLCAYLARQRPRDAGKLTQEVLLAARKADDIDSSYGGGMARRLLGAIYIYAPAWPNGVGDLDEAIEVLEAVHKDFPEHPLNVYYLAEAYRRAEQIGDALRLYKKVLTFPKRGRWALEGRIYRQKTRQAIADLTRPR